VSDLSEPEFHELIAEQSSISMPALTVSVDFIELLDRVGESEAYRMVGQLKDLLG
jgi:hypothetical protein